MPFENLEEANTAFDKLQTDHNKLQADYGELNNSHAGVVQERDTLQTQYTAMEKQFGETQTQLGELKTGSDVLQQTNTDLEAKLKEFQDNQGSLVSREEADTKYTTLETEYTGYVKDRLKNVYSISESQLEGKSIAELKAIEIGATAARGTLSGGSSNNDRTLNPLGLGMGGNTGQVSEPLTTHEEDLKLVEQLRQRSVRGRSNGAVDNV